MPARLERAMLVLAGPGAAEVAVGDLSPYLDERGRLVLVRRLVREGLLERVGAGGRAR